MNGRAIVSLVLAPLAVLAGFVLLSQLLAAISGWRRLATSYANNTPFEASQWRFAQATITRWVLLNANLTLRVGADRQFLYLQTWPFNFPGFRELRVPWRDVSTKQRKILFWKFFRMRFEEQPEILIQTSEAVMQLTLRGVGGIWANDRAEFSA